MQRYNKWKKVRNNVDIINDIIERKKNERNNIC